MISAKEALELEQAKFPPADLIPFRAVMRQIDSHIRKTMKFPVPKLFEIKYEDMDVTVFELVSAAMKRQGWNVKANIVQEASRFHGGQPMPVRWQLTITPLPEVLLELEIVKEAAIDVSFPADGSEVFQ